jgi:hypothetical protein
MELMEIQLINPLLLPGLIDSSLITAVITHQSPTLIVHKVTNSSGPLLSAEYGWRWSFGSDSEDSAGRRRFLEFLHKFVTGSFLLSCVLIN